MANESRLNGWLTWSLASFLALAVFVWFRHSSTTANPPTPPEAPTTAEGRQSTTTPTTLVEPDQLDPVSRLDSTPPQQLEATPTSIRDYTDFSAMVAGHLQLAPRDLQNSARDFFLLQATHMDKMAEQARAGGNLEAIVSELDCMFMARVRRACADLLATGKGLLVVDGLPYDKRIRGKHWLLWGGTGQSQLFGRQLQVLVPLDEADPELETLERALVDARAAMLAERLEAFNSRSFTDRAEEIERFQSRNRQPRSGPESSWFGIDGHYINQLRVDTSTMTVRPIL